MPRTDLIPYESNNIRTYKLICVMQHIERGTLQKLYVSHFITMIMVNVSHIFGCFIDWNKSSKRFGFCLLKVVINLIVHNQNIKKRVWVTLTIMMVMN